MVKHSKTFNLKDGKKFSTLKGLAKELKSMADDTFFHHVNEHKNDFARWIKHSLKKDKLSETVEKRLNKVELELEILRHLVHDVKVEATDKIKVKIEKAKEEIAKEKIPAKKELISKKKVTKSKTVNK